MYSKYFKTTFKLFYKNIEVWKQFKIKSFSKLQGYARHAPFRYVDIVTANMFLKIWKEMSFRHTSS